jgi:hypothetical protein
VPFHDAEATYGKDSNGNLTVHVFNAEFYIDEVFLLTYDEGFESWQIDGHPEQLNNIRRGIYRWLQDRGLVD